MRNLFFSASMLVIAAALSGCATHETSKFDAASSLGDTSRVATRYSAEQAAKNAYAWGDHYTAANLFLQADQADNTVMNRFNLATAYAAIGKTDQASVIYDSLVVDGQFTWLTEDSINGDHSQTSTLNVSDESKKRVAALDAMEKATGSIGVESGTGVTNEQARFLDQSAEDARAKAGVTAAGKAG